MHHNDEYNNRTIIKPANIIALLLLLHNRAVDGFQTLIADYQRILFLHHNQNFRALITYVKGNINTHRGGKCWFEGFMQCNSSFSALRRTEPSDYNFGCRAEGLLKSVSVPETIER